MTGYIAVLLVICGGPLLAFVLADFVPVKHVLLLLALSMVFLGVCAYVLWLL